MLEEIKFIAVIRKIIKHAGSADRQQPYINFLRQMRKRGELSSAMMKDMFEMELMDILPVKIKDASEKEVSDAKAVAQYLEEQFAPSIGIVLFISKITQQYDARFPKSELEVVKQARIDWDQGTL